MKRTRRQFVQTATAASTRAVLSQGNASADTTQTCEDRSSGADGGWKAREFANKKLHIVLAVLDDAGFGDLGCWR